MADYTGLTQEQWNELNGFKEENTNPLVIGGNIGGQGSISAMFTDPTTAPKEDAEPTIPTVQAKNYDGTAYDPAAAGYSADVINFVNRAHKEHAFLKRQIPDPLSYSLAAAILTGGNEAAVMKYADELAKQPQDRQEQIPSLLDYASYSNGEFDPAGFTAQVQAVINSRGADAQAKPQDESPALAPEDLNKFLAARAANANPAPVVAAAPVPAKPLRELKTDRLMPNDKGEYLPFNPKENEIPDDAINLVVNAFNRVPNLTSRDVHPTELDYNFAKLAVLSADAKNEEELSSYAKDYAKFLVANNMSSTEHRFANTSFIGYVDSYLDRQNSNFTIKDINRLVHIAVNEKPQQEIAATTTPAVTQEIAEETVAAADAAQEKKIKNALDEFATRTPPATAQVNITPPPLVMSPQPAPVVISAPERPAENIKAPVQKIDTADLVRSAMAVSETASSAKSLAKDALSTGLGIAGKAADAKDAKIAAEEAADLVIKQAEPELAAMQTTPAMPETTPDVEMTRTAATPAPVEMPTKEAPAAPILPAASAKPELTERQKEFAHLLGEDGKVKAKVDGFKAEQLAGIQEYINQGAPTAIRVDEAELFVSEHGEGVLPAREVEVTEGAQPAKLQPSVQEIAKQLQKLVDGKAGTDGDVIEFIQNKMGAVLDLPKGEPKFVKTSTSYQIIDAFVRFAEDGLTDVERDELNVITKGFIEANKGVAVSSRGQFKDVEADEALKPTELKANVEALAKGEELAKK